MLFRSEKPHFDDGRNAAFQARVRGGSFGMVSPSLRWWQKLGSRTRVAVDAAYMRADGNYPFTLVNGKYVTEEKRNNTGIYSWQGEATLYHTFKDDSELDVKGYYFYSRRGLPGAVTLYNPLSDETLWDENTFVQARYRKHFSPRKGAASCAGRISEAAARSLRRRPNRRNSRAKSGSA